MRNIQKIDSYCKICVYVAFFTSKPELMITPVLNSCERDEYIRKRCREENTW